ncbi:MAG TPA: hypothetical protein VFB58_05925 [Chloroflexota bacterium]|nr:hypothetical protein [Chloroflexota bacterium]
MTLRTLIIVTLGALVVLSTPAVRADSRLLHRASQAIILRGTIKGMGIRRMTNPDGGALYHWKGHGTVRPLGVVSGRGTNHAVGFISQGTPTGTMTLTSTAGSIKLKITYDQTRGFAPLPTHGLYTITGGTGQYAGAHGSGSVLRHQGTCSGGTSSGQCPIGATFPVTYQFTSGTGAKAKG